jgi:hypothetical protein
MTEGGVVYVGIANDVDEIALTPAPVDHILFAKRKKAHNQPPEFGDFSITFI